MRLHFLFGGSGAGKTHRLLMDVAARSAREPARQFIVLVPEQFTNETQKGLLRLHPGHVTLNVDVLSFERLAHRVFAEVGGSNRQMLGEVGKSLLLERIALQMGGELEVLGHNLTRPGSVAQMKSMVSELLLYGITPGELLLHAEKSGKTLLSRKLTDIARVYERFLSEMGDRFQTAEEVPDVLARVADRSSLLRGAVLVLDGYTGFTPVQYLLIRKLMTLAAEMTVAVTIPWEENPFGKGRTDDIFSLSRDTVQSLRQLAREEGVPVTWEDAGVCCPPHLAEEGVPVTKGESGNKATGRFCRARSLAHLENALFRKEKRLFIGKPGEIRLVAAKSPLEEVREAARFIASMVRESQDANASAETAVPRKTNFMVRGSQEAQSPTETASSLESAYMMHEMPRYRYRDFAVITGDLPGYGSLVRQVFSEMEIPFFVDEKRSLLRNPLLEYVRAAVQVLAESFSTESTIRFLRSGLTGLAPDTVDRLENYILGAGLRGKSRWQRPIDKPYRDEDPEEIPLLEAARGKLMERLGPLSEAFAKRKGTVAEKAEALYDFLLQSGVEAELARRAAAFAEKGRADLAREYRQVYARVVDFLDRLVGLLGPEAVSMRDFRDLLEAGLAEEKIAIIPPGTDQVLVGDMERSRLGNVKVLLFLGVNEGLVPKRENGGGLLSESDRELLSSAGVKLKPTARENIAISRFYMYLALTKPCSFLYVSYAEADSAGGLLRPSYLVTELRCLFPDLSTSLLPTAFAKRLERPANAHSLLVEGFSGLSAGTLDPAFMELFAYFWRQMERRPQLEALLAASVRRKRSDAIGKAAARAIYGQRLVNSASRLEQFAACEFAQFVRYGLRLRERAEFRFTALDMGNVVHDALERFGKGLLREGLSWTEISDKERDRRLLEALEEATAGYGSGILLDSPRNAYQVVRMGRLLRTSVWAMQEQLRRGAFAPAWFEMAFGGGELAFATFDLGDGASLALTGRIDRVDICQDGQDTCLKIVDYKTGSRAFDLASFYHGLQLQLVVYLGAAREVLEKSGRRVRPAGMFYYEIKDPVVKPDAAMTEEELGEEILKEMRASGLVAGDRETLLLLDRTLSGGGKSLVIPAELTKKGELSKNSKAVSPEQFQCILDFAQKKIRDIGRKILAGEADVNPYRFRGRTACDYCALKGICGFDPKIAGYRFRELPALKAEEVFGKIEEEV